ncbi:unnamed protein product [Rhodiola kirilowii]
MDFITHLPASKGKTVIFVVVDRLTKYAHFMPLQSGFTSEMVAKVFAKEVFRLHGVPNSIVSDRDPIFLSCFWKELFRIQGTTLSHSSAYHPQTDGQSEVVNRGLEDYLRCFINEQQTNWVELLPWAEYSYNTAWHSSIGMTPFEAVYGRKATDVIPYTTGDSKVSALDDMLQHKMTILDQLKGNLRKAQQRMVQQANQHRANVEYEVGDWVIVRLQPYRQSTVRNQRTTKLTRRYYGPFEVVQRIEKVAYRVSLPEGAKIHNVFHVSLLKKWHGQSQGAVTSWPQEFFESHPLVQPAKVLGFRTIVRRGKTWPQHLIQWEQQTVEDATWEDEVELARDYPSLNLEVEVPSEGGRNDTGQIMDPKETDQRMGRMIQPAGEGARRSTRQRIHSLKYSPDTYELNNRIGSGGTELGAERIVENSG